MVRNATIFMSFLLMLVLLAAVYTGVNAMPSRGGGVAEHARHVTVAITAVLFGMAVCSGAFLVVMGAEAQIRELEDRLAAAERAASETAPAQHADVRSATTASSTGDASGSGGGSA